MRRESLRIVPLQLAAAVFAVACGSSRLYHTSGPPPLSSAALAVEFVPGTQAVSLDLDEKCQAVGAVAQLSSETAMRRRAASLGADIVQVIYGSTTTTTDSLTIGSLTLTEKAVVNGPSTVRFWICGG